jgi:hypothetical protein
VIDCFYIVCFISLKMSTCSFSETSQWISMQFHNICLKLKLSNLSSPFIIINFYWMLVLNICHHHHPSQLTDLFWPQLIISWKVFQVSFIHLVYTSALFFASWCTFMLHVIATLICIFLVSCEMVLLSTLPKFLHSQNIVSHHNLQSSLSNAITGLDRPWGFQEV